MDTVNVGLRLVLKGEKAHQICSFMWTDNFLEQMLSDLIEEAEMWDLAPKLASLLLVSTYEEEERSEVLFATKGLMYKFSCREKFKILGCAMNRQGKSLDAIEESAVCQQSFLEGHFGLQKHRCAVENQVQKIGGPCLFRRTCANIVLCGFSAIWMLTMEVLV